MNAGIVKAELCLSPALMRYPCHLCGGRTSKNPVHCMVQSGDHAGFRICETCLKRHAGPGSVNAALIERAREVLRAASRDATELLALVDRLQLPSFSEWGFACDAHDARARKAEECDQ